MILGIDYGSKYAGTTSICAGDEKGRIFSLVQSKKKFDADEFIRKKVVECTDPVVFIDAPLSLPGVYRDLPGFNDYFYRDCDRKIGAMSPMFLGGLTARAIQLKHYLNHEKIEVYEAWPSKMAAQFHLSRKIYKASASNISKCLNSLNDSYKLLDIPSITSWHQFDSLLVYIIGLRFLKGEAIAFGTENEGVIYV